MYLFFTNTTRKHAVLYKLHQNADHFPTVCILDISKPCLLIVVVDILQYLHLVSCQSGRRSGVSCGG